MAGPWEKYAAQSPQGDKPWLKYGSAPANPNVSAPKTSHLTPQQIERINAAKAGTLQVSPESLARHGLDQKTQDAGAIDQAGTPFGYAAKFAQGVPFVGQYVDELAGAIGGALGENDQAAALRNLQGAMDREHPYGATAAQIAGGIAGSIPMAVAAAPSVAAAAPTTLLGQVGAGVVAGGSAGAIEGAVSGYGAGNDGDRVKSALSGGMVGGALGGIVGGVGPVLSRGLGSIVEHFKKTDTNIIARAFGISPKAAQMMKADLEALDFPSAQRNLQTAGADAMVADAGISTREALDSAITGGGAASQIGTRAVSDRAAVAGGRLSRVMDAVLGVPEGIKGAAKSIAARTAPIRQKAYDAAYASAVNYADDTGRNIEGVLAKIPSGTLKTAISEANDAMQAAGIKNKQIMAEIAKDGSVVFKEMPNVQQLDEIKKALGVVGREVDQLGRPTASANRANRLARELKGAISEAVPVYKRAVALGGDKIAEDNALLMGRKLFTAGTSRETVQETMKGASLEAQDAARRGIRSYIDDTLARVRRSIDDPGVDTTETRRLLDTLSTRDAREKMTVVLGQAKAERLFTAIDAAGKQFATRQAVATGSATGRRMARNAGFDAAVAPGIVGTAGTGKALPTIQSVVQAVTRQTPQNAMAQKQKLLAEVATALTQKRGQDAQNALAIVQQAIAGQPVKSADAARLGRLLASSGVLLVDQTARQSLAIQRGAK